MDKYYPYLYPEYRLKRKENTIGSIDKANPNRVVVSFYIFSTPSPNSFAI
jgi:hypothetical protein